MKTERENNPARRIVLGIEYDGSCFHGWQRQTDAASIQAEVEKSLSSVADHEVEVTCAGRTDTGVHATSQVIHFDCQTARPDKAWLKGANSLLPSTISIRYCKTVEHEFHARFSALSRSYLYIIDNQPVRPAIMNQGITWHQKQLDVDQMNQACKYFPGEQDFSSFRSSQCQSKSVNRFISQLQCRRFSHYVVIEITANAFLHHMVRNIVGVLLEIGDGRKKPAWANQVLVAKDRCSAGITAAARGLYLVGVKYPPQFNLPSVNNRPLFLQQLMT